MIRLLHRTADGSLVLTKWAHNIPKYAILSHTWAGDDEEVTFADLKRGEPQSKPVGFHKIQFCEQQAAKDGFEYFWVDTCCIKKDNNTELQEAIASMFKWYRNAAACYVYLADVSTPDIETNQQLPPHAWELAFRQSRWFTRGWTLQELLAPATVQFFSVQGTRLGDKRSLEKYIHDTTGIPLNALRGEALTNFSIAERLSWAEKRQTKRPEDKAYSLLGIFNVFMPLIYGEEENAFARLREELQKKYAENDKFERSLSILPVASQAAFNSFDNQHGPTCLPNTRVELLQQITEWINGPDERCIYWLNGIAGTGKSTIARTIARTYHEQDQLGASFLFSRGGGDVGLADRFVTTLAHQLANKITSLRRYICEAIMKHSDIAEQSLRDQWDQLILNPLLKLDGNCSSPRIVIVIDALDECDSERDIRIILRLLATTRLVKTPRLRVFITSRPEIPIRCGFSHIPEAERQVFALHEISPETVDRDLSLFFEKNLSEMREERGFGDDWPGWQIIRRLVEGSCGLFIWAATACRFIREGRRFAMNRIALLVSGNRSDDGPQKRLDEIYIMVLKDSVSQDYNEKEKRDLYEILREILGSIVLLFSPLPTSSLANLLDRPPSDIDDTLTDLHTIFYIPSRSDRPIRLHHPTFRDFLLDRNRCSDLNFWVDQKQVHKALADSCISIMTRMLKRDICDLKLPGTLAKDVDPTQIEECIPPELQYACLYWAEHYRQSGLHLSDGDRAHCFLKDFYLYWFEAINLMGKSAEMAAIIRMYHSILRPELNVEQIPFIKDARRFMFAFQSIIKEAPLQVYCAALVFIKPTNTLQTHFRSQLHPSIKDFRIAQAIAPDAKDEYNYFNDVVFTPDGKQIASGSTNEVVRVWDVATKATLDKFLGQTDKVSSVDISPDGTTLASGSDDTTVMIFDMRTKAVRAILKDHSRWVCSAIFSPNGKLLASCSMDETIIVWDTKTWKNLHAFDNHSSCVNSISFSPDGAMIASGSVDEVIRIWNISKEEIHMSLYGHSGCINSVKVSPDGKQILSGSDDMTIRIWNWDTGAEEMVIKGHSGKVTAVTYSPDGRLIASGSEDKTVMLWEASSGTHLATLKGHTSGINAVTFSPDGHLLASGAFNDEMRFWDAKTGASRGELDEFKEADDAKQVASSGSHDIAESHADPLPTVTSGELKGHSSTVTCVTVSPGGRFIVSGSQDATIKIWLKEGKEQYSLEGHEGSINHLAFSPDSHLLASASLDETVKVWDTITGAMIHSFNDHSGNVLHVSFSPDSCLLASCSTDKTVRLWNAKTGEPLANLQGHVDTVTDVVFSPNNRLLASCSADTTIKLWDLESQGANCMTLGGHSDIVSSIAFSSDSRSLVSCSADATIRLWNTAGEACGTIKCDMVPVNSVALSPDGKLVVSSLIDKTVRLWDANTGSSHGMRDVGVAVRAVFFSGDGQFIETDRGVLDVASVSLDLTSLSPERPLTAFAAQDWVRRDTVNTIWLPDEYHATSVATVGRMIILGHAAGSMSFIHF